jgi:hemerythrin-like domain-containing protein
MRRHQVLAPLSRDHQRGLLAAHRLIGVTLADAAEARSRFLSFWLSEGNRHFRCEEEVLLPAFARHAPADHEAVVRVLTEHVDIRRRAFDLEVLATPGVEALRELGQRLRDHIRHEERVLFPLIEEALPQSELNRLPGAMLAAEDAA